MEEIKESQPVSPLFTGGELKRLIIPLVIEQLLLMTVGMADTVMDHHRRRGRRLRYIPGG